MGLEVKIYDIFRFVCFSSLGSFEQQVLFRADIHSEGSMPEGGARGQNTMPQGGARGKNTMPQGGVRGQNTMPQGGVRGQNTVSRGVVRGQNLVIYIKSISQGYTYLPPRALS